MKDSNFKNIDFCEHTFFLSDEIKHEVNNKIHTTLEKSLQIILDELQETPAKIVLSGSMGRREPSIEVRENKIRLLSDIDIFIFAKSIASNLVLMESINAALSKANLESEVSVFVLDIDKLNIPFMRDSGGSLYSTLYENLDCPVYNNTEELHLLEPCVKSGALFRSMMVRLLNHVSDSHLLFRTEDDDQIKVDKVSSSKRLLLKLICDVVILYFNNEHEDLYGNGGTATLMAYSENGADCTDLLGNLTIENIVKMLDGGNPGYSLLPELDVRDIVEKLLRKLTSEEDIGSDEFYYAIDEALNVNEKYPNHLMKLELYGTLLVIGGDDRYKTHLKNTIQAIQKNSGNTLSDMLSQLDALITDENYKVKVVPILQKIHSTVLLSMLTECQNK